MGLGHRKVVVLAAMAASSGCLSAPPGEDQGCGVNAGDCVTDDRFAPFADSFDSGDLPWAMTWMEGDVTSTIGVESGRLVITPSGSPGDYVGLFTAPLDWNGRQLSTEVVAMTNPAATSCEVWLGLDGPDDASLLFFHEDGLLHAPGLSQPVSYDRREHRWWQIVVGDQVSFQVSADGVNWCDLSQVPVPGWIGSATFELGSGTFQDETDLNLGTFTIDNLNLPPDRCGPTTTSLD